MRFSSYVEKMGGGDTAAVHDAWSVHGKARQRQRAGEDIILLSIGDHDFATDPRIVAAAKTALDGGRHHYTPNLGEPATRQAAVDFHQRAIGEAVTPDHVAIVPGAQAGAFTAAMAVLDAGDEVICFDPMYVTYAGVIMAPGAVMRFVPLRPENGFQPDPAEVRRAVGPRTRAIMLNSPHNPTGAVIPRAVLAALGDIAVAHDLWLISDEVYCTMTFERPHVSPRLIDGLRERTLSIYSLSKAFAMTGWRMGWVVAEPAVVDRLDFVLGSMLFGTPPFSQDALVAAIATAFDETSRIRDLYRRRRDVICDALAALPALKFSRPEAGMFLMIDVRGTGMGSLDFAESLLAERNVAVLPGEGFGASQAGFVRLSYGTDEATLAEAARRIAAHVSALTVAGQRATVG